LRFHGFCLAVRLMQRCGNGLAGIIESGQLPFPLDMNAQVCEMRLEQPLGFRLRQHQPERVRAYDAAEADMANGFAADNDIRGVGFMAGGDEGGGAIRAIQQFQRAAPQHQRLGFVGALRGLVHNANANPVARQFGRHGEPHRARANHQNLRVHTHPPFLTSLQARAVPQPCAKNPAKITIGLTAFCRPPPSSSLPCCLVSP